jgi:aquaporin Z
MNLTKRCIAEFLGTAWLVLGGCGSAVLAASYTEAKTQGAGEAAAKAASALGIGTFGVSIAFGLTVVSMAFAIGHISGCHLNPAVSFGLWASKRFPSKELLPYIGSQTAGAFVSALFIYLIANGKDGYSLNGTNPLATNGFMAHSPQNYGLVACFLIELVMTFFFLLTILGATDKRAPQGFAGIPIGLMLMLIHLVSIPVTNTSVNPARTTGPAIVVAIFGKAELLAQVWLFWLAPILGAVLAGYLYLNVFEENAGNVTEQR